MLIVCVVSTISLVSYCIDNIPYVAFVHIRIKRACDLHPLTPHFYIVKLGCTGVYVFPYFCSTRGVQYIMATCQ